MGHPYGRIVDLDATAIKVEWCPPLADGRDDIQMVTFQKLTTISPLPHPFHAEFVAHEIRDG